MADIRTTTLGGIPFGINSQRPTNPQPGQPFFNGQENRLELYTQNVGWQNIVGETPGVISISGEYLESNATNIITISGTNFVSGALAYAIGTNGVEVPANATAVNSIVEIAATFSGLSSTYEPYDIKVVNPSNLYGLLNDILYVNSSPVWTTAAGSLGTFDEKTTQSVQLVTTDIEETPVTYSITSGSLPSGITLSSSGLISGTLSEVSSTSTYNFTVTASDGANVAPRSFFISVTNLPPSWVTPSGSLSTFTKDVPYSTTIQATDAHEITYSLVSGSLPVGLSLNLSSGIISGTPTGDTSQTFTVRATNLGGDYADRIFNIPNAGPTWITASPINTFTRNSAYSTTLIANDDSGNIPTYSLFSGSLPDGLSLNSSSGVISGTPTSSTAATFTVRASDINGNYSDREFFMPNSAPTWSTTTLPDASGGTSYSQQLLATDDSGVSPIYSLISGSLPSGLSLSSSGLISGSPTVVGSQTFSIRATDANGGYAERSFSINVSSGISATGGTIYTSGGYKYHVFTGTSSFSVSSNGTSTTAQVLVVAGGGSGGNDVGGGGGAGGIIYNSSYSIPAGSYTVTVGGGGTGASSGQMPGVGSDSYFGPMRAYGGGYSDNWQLRVDAVSGGSGGGGGGYGGVPRLGKASTQTSNNGGIGYGNAGGNGLSPELGTNVTTPSAGGGGGAGEIGQNGTVGQNGRGGNGLNTWSSWASITGTGADGGYFGGGGGGASDHNVNANGPGGLGGGGLGRSGIDGNNVGASGLANTGGGGGGSNSYPGGSGGSGIVIVRYQA